MRAPVTRRALIVIVVALLCTGCLGHRIAERRTGTAAATGLTAATTARLGIPSAGTVLALPGADLHVTNDMDEEFCGAFSTPPYTMKVVDYPRNLALDSIPTGVANIDAAIRATPGTIIVLAYSQGAQVASEWMRQHSHDPTAPGPDRLTFVLFGNPLRASGGAKVGEPTVRTTGLATPTDTPWHIVDVARRYDGYADSPTDKNNAEAVHNADLGKLLIHPHYEGVDLGDPSLTVWQRGNTTFVLTNEAPLLPNAGAQIESAYRRD